MLELEIYEERGTRHATSGMGRDRGNIIFSPVQPSKFDHRNGAANYYVKEHKRNRTYYHALYIHFTYLTPGTNSR